MKLEELIGSLQSFELAISDRSEKKNKSTTFISNTDNEKAQCDTETDEGIFNAIVLLGRQFNKVLKRMDRKSRPNVKNMSFYISKNSDSQRKEKAKNTPNQGKGIQCHGYEGLGHIRSECPMYLKKQKKDLFVSWSDDDYEGEIDDETAKHVTPFTGRYETDEDSCDENINYEELSASYKELYVRSEEVCNTGEEKKRIIAQLQAEKQKLLSTITDLENEVTVAGNS